MKVINLVSESGEWEGLYVNGELVTEGHRIDRKEWLELAELYGYHSSEIKTKYLNQEDEDATNDGGSFYESLVSFKGNYND